MVVQRSVSEAQTRRRADLLVRTPLVEQQIADQAATHGIPESEVVEKIMLTRSAIKRLCEPGEVAALAAFLMTDDAGMVTGTSHTMDGGWTAQ